MAGGQEYLIQGIGRISSVDDIAQTVVVSRDARPILVRDLGEVRIGEALKRGEGSHDAKPAVILGIQKQPGTNTLELTQRLDVVLDEIQKTLPAGMTIDKHIFRQADFIEIAVHNLLSALRDGGLLVIFVVVLFLANIRASVITLLAIPLSLVAALWGMKAAGLTINTMSLGGLAIAIGGLVDDAIIDVENVFRRLRENSLKPADQQAREGGGVSGQQRDSRVRRVRDDHHPGRVAALFLLESVEGRLLKPLGFAYVVALRPRWWWR